MDILHLEDNRHDAELIRRELTRSSINANVVHVATEHAFRAALRERAFDVILADYHLPGFSGTAALEIAKDLAPGTPFIFVSGAIGEERAVEALQQGATDYILKDRITRLGSAVTRALAERQSQKALLLSQERFRLVAQATLDVIWDWSVVDDVFWANDAIRSQWGHAIDDDGATNEWWSAQIYPAEAQGVYESLLAAVDAGEPRWQRQYRFRRGDGTYGHVHDRAIILRDESGRAVRVIGVMQDMTALVEAEQQLEQEQRISGLGRLAAMISHEFGNVLMGIQPFAEVVAKRGADDPMLAKAAQHIASSVARGRQIANDILRTANPGAPSLETLDLAAWLREVSAEISGIVPVFSIDVPPSPAIVRCDPRQLHQVIMNLAINARDAMKGSGELRITMNIDSGEAVVAVADTGCGIPEDLLTRVFDPLFTTKPNGTGLGLAVSKQIVARNGGKIAAESAVGRGTVFTITLPIVETETT